MRQPDCDLSIVAIVPLNNGAQWIERCIATVPAQTPPNLNRTCIKVTTDSAYYSNRCGDRSSPVATALPALDLVPFKPAGAPCFDIDDADAALHLKRIRRLEPIKDSRWT